MREEVKDYYGKTLQSSDDLQTNACCTDAAMPDFAKPVVSNVHDEVLTRYYGCGLILPEQLTGMTILDLGCGAGRDVYVLSQLVGESGRVIGVDMTPEQLEVANKHKDYHVEKFGYAQSNVEFHHGYIEELDKLGIEPGSVDIVVSNCVINLSDNKEAVLKGVWDLLKPGGEMYFSDVYGDRRLADELQQDPLLVGECLGGALYWNDFQNLAKHCGFADPRLVNSRRLTIDNKALEARLGRARFYSATYRLFKIEELEPFCEDYGQAVIYKGTIDNAPDAFVLDEHHDIETGKVFAVCGNTWRMLEQTRFKEHFEFIGDWNNHYGIFDGCGTAMPFSEGSDVGSDGAGIGNEASSGGCC